MQWSLNNKRLILLPHILCGAAESTLFQEPTRQWKRSRPFGIDILLGPIEDRGKDGDNTRVVVEENIDTYKYFEWHSVAEGNIDSFFFFEWYIRYMCGAREHWRTT